MKQSYKRVLVSTLMVLWGNDVQGQNSAFRLIGSEDCLELPSELIDLSDGLTMEGWFFVEPSPSYASFFDIGSPENGIALQLGSTGDYIGLTARSPGDPYSKRIFVACEAIGKWIHVAAVMKENRMTLYINGTFAGSDSYRTSFDRIEVSGAFYVGRSFAEEASLVGWLDKIRVWHVALLEEQIKANMYRSFSGTEKGLQALYSFQLEDRKGVEFESESLVFDSTPFHHHGTSKGEAALEMRAGPDPKATLTRFAKYIGPMYGGQPELTYPQVFVPHGILARAGPVAFSSDDRYLAAAPGQFWFGEADSGLRIWDTQTGELLRNIRVVGGVVDDIEFHPKRTEVALGTESGWLNIYNLDPLEKLYEYRVGGYPYRVRSLAYSPNGKYLAFEDGHGLVRVLDEHRNIRLIKTQQFTEGPIRGPTITCFSSDGKTIATGSSYTKEGGIIELWNLEDLNSICKWSVGDQYLKSVAFGRGDHTLLTCGTDRIPKLWEVTSGKRLLTLGNGESEPANAYRAFFSRDFETIVTSGHDGVVRMWDADSGKPVKSIHATEGLCSDISFSWNGEYMAASGADSSVTIWGWEDGKQRYHFSGFDRHRNTKNLRMAFRNDGKELAIGSHDSTITLWDLDRIKYQGRLVGPLAEIQSLHYSPNANSIAVSSASNMAYIFDLKTRRAQELGLRMPIYDFIWSPDGNWLSGACYHSPGSSMGEWDDMKSVFMLNAASQEMVFRFDGLDSSVLDLAFSPDGKILAGACLDGSVKLWEVPSGKLKGFLPDLEKPLGYIDYGADGSRLAAASVESPTIGIWRVNTEGGLPVFQREIHTGGLKLGSLSFSSDGTRIAASDWGVGAKVWDVETGELLVYIRDQLCRPSEATFSPDGRYLALSDAHDKVRFYDANTYQKLFQISLLPGGEWIVNHLFKPQYSASPEGDKEAMLRFGSNLDDIQPLSFYRDELKHDDGLAEVWSEESPEIQPKYWLRQWDRARKSGQVATIIQMAKLVGMIGFVVASLCYYVRYELKRKDFVRMQARMLRQEQEARSAFALKNKELSVMKEAADQANLAKSRFLANMSHEIRTPMNAVLGYAQILRRRFDTDQFKDLDERPFIGIEKGAEHLMGIINQVLDLSRIEAGDNALNLDSFDLPSFLQDLKGVMQGTAEQKGIGIEFDYDLKKEPMLGDHQKLRQILINLLVNAIKFTHTGLVTLKVRSLNGPVAGGGKKKSHSNVWFRFEVIDTGGGVSKEMTPVLFDPFARDSNSSGSGLGLAIVQSQVHLMDGKVGYQTREGEGSTFWVELPFERSSIKKNPKPDPDMVSPLVRLASDCKIRSLVVDDVEANREVLHQMLEDLGCQVNIACSGEEALELLELELAEIVFLDIRMPQGMSGVETAKKIKNLPKYGADGSVCRLVAVSASALNHERDELLQSEFDAFIGKPVNMAELVECLRNQLGAQFTNNSKSKMKRVMEAELTTRSLKPDHALKILTELNAAAEIANLTMCLEHLDGLSKIGSVERQYAEELRALAENYRWDEFVRHLKNITTKY